MHEALETELAGELLELTSEQELDRFLGNLLSPAVGAGKAFLGSDAGKAVGGLVKGAAKQALPQIGRALGDLILPGRAASWEQLASRRRASSGWSWKGSPPRTASWRPPEPSSGSRTRRPRSLEAAPASVSPTAAAAHAATVAAQHHLPGIASVVRELRPPGTPASGALRPASGGRWVRHGPTIVLQRLGARVPVSSPTNPSGRDSAASLGAGG